MMLKHLSALLVLLCLLHSCNGLKHDLKIHKDDRSDFFIENFGFAQGGIYNLTLKSFEIDGREVTKEDSMRVGFIIRKTETDSAAFIEEKPPNDDTCLQSMITNRDKIIDVYTIMKEGNPKGNFFLKVENKEDEDLYNTYFVNCPGKDVSFELILEQYNVGSDNKRNYLSIGSSPLPTVYGCFTAIYAVLLVVWIMQFIRAKDVTLNRVHHLITVFIILKMLSLLFKTVEQHYIKTTGSAAGWNVLYYIFTALKGTMLFVLIALIGSGWSFIKPFLSDKDKKIFLIVIPLQLLDNIALIITEETAPGSQGWFTWKDIFRLVDIICCGAILIPIIWSIKHLREASQIDGKAARNLRKLKLFRQFYLMVVSYIYFTRIIVYLVDATLPFRVIWLGDFSLELAALAFFCVTGWKFRPASNNPYFALELEEVGEEPSAAAE